MPGPMPRLPQRLAQALSGASSVIHVFNKADAVDPAVALDPSMSGRARLVTKRCGPLARLWRLSARTGDGLSEPCASCLLEHGRLAGTQTEGVFIARQRHVQALQGGGVTHVGLAQASMPPCSDGALDLLAEELRLAHDALGRITGAFSRPMTCWVKFSARFCIGK